MQVHYVVHVSHKNPIRVSISHHTLRLLFLGILLKLFPRDVFPGRGRAYAEENRDFATPSFDGQWRVWKKSDPATTGAYDKMSVEYIVNSVEGRKYWHFFKNMLLGSEEHYYIRYM